MNNSFFLFLVFAADDIIIQKKQCRNTDGKPHCFLFLYIRLIYIC